MSKVMFRAVSLQQPMPPHGVGPSPQQELYIYAGNHWVTPCTITTKK